MKANNNKALRDALATIANCDYDFVEGSYRYEGHICADIARKALAEPPRNCDVGTAEEQIERFDEFCNAQCSNDCRDCDTCPLFNSWKLKDNCQIIWGQMPYEGGDSK